MILYWLFFALAWILDYGFGCFFAFRVAIILAHYAFQTASFWFLAETATRQLPSERERESRAKREKVANFSLWLIIGWINFEWFIFGNYLCEYAMSVEPRAAEREREKKIQPTSRTLSLKNNNDENRRISITEYTCNKIIEKAAHPGTYSHTHTHADICSDENNINFEKNNTNWTGAQRHPVIKSAKIYMEVMWMDDRERGKKWENESERASERKKIRTNRWSKVIKHWPSDKYLRYLLKVRQAENFFFRLTLSRSERTRRSKCE